MPRRKRSRKGSDSDGFRKRYGVGKKLLKNRSGHKQVKYEEKRSIPGCEDRGRVPVTPQMIRLAVKELHTRRVFVSSSLIASHLRRCYPIESDPAVLKRELADKLAIAVCVGLIAKCGADAYCLPTLRQQATTHKTDFSSFWERYNFLIPTEPGVAGVGGVSYGLKMKIGFHRVDQPCMWNDISFEAATFGTLEKNGNTVFITDCSIKTLLSEMAKRGPRTRRKNCLENPRRSLKKPLQRGLADYPDNDDNTADIP